MLQGEHAGTSLLRRQLELTLHSAAKSVTSLATAPRAVRATTTAVATAADVAATVVVVEDSAARAEAKVARPATHAVVTAT